MVISLKRPWSHCGTSITACLPACTIYVAALLLSEQCHSRLCLPLLIVFPPLSPSSTPLPGAVHGATSLRNKGEPSSSLLHRHELVAGPPLIRDCAVEHNTWRCVEYASPYPSTEFIIKFIITPSRHRMWRDVTRHREQGSMPYRSLPCCTIFAAPSPLISVFLSPCAPLGSSYPTPLRRSFLITSMSLLTSSDLILCTTGRTSVPLRHTLLTIPFVGRKHPNERAGKAQTWAYPGFIHLCHSLCGASSFHLPPPKPLRKTAE